MRSIDVTPVKLLGIHYRRFNQEYSVCDISDIRTWSTCSFAGATTHGVIFRRYHLTANYELAQHSSWRMLRPFFPVFSQTLLAMDEAHPSHFVVTVALSISPRLLHPTVPMPWPHPRHVPTPHRTQYWWIDWTIATAQQSIRCMLYCQEVRGQPHL